MHAPQLPSSFGSTGVAVQALVFALAYVAPKVRSMRDVVKAIDRIRATSKVAAEDIRETALAAERAKLTLTGASSAASKLDELAEVRTALHALQEPFDRSKASVTAVIRALTDARRFDGPLSMAIPGWRTHADEFFAQSSVFASAEVAEFERVLRESIEEVDELFVEGQRLAMAGAYPYVEHSETKVVAAEALADWEAGLPDDDWAGAWDPGEEKTVSWTDDGRAVVT